MSLNLSIQLTRRQKFGRDDALIGHAHEVKNSSLTNRQWPRVKGHVSSGYLRRKPNLIVFQISKGVGAVKLPNFKVELLIIIDISSIDLFLFFLFFWHLLERNG
ncbi:hypothetical protein ES703_85284 [subsurface metagenome]